MKEYNEYQKEQNKLLMDFLIEKERTEPMVEFIISSYCNQACEYCYLYKHGTELYPSNIQNFNEIVRNFEILLDWLDEKEFTFNDYDFFSGEYFKLPIWEDLFQIIYDREVIKYKKDPRQKNITIPTNGSFLLDEEQTKKLENWMQKLGEIGVDIQVSFSVEGPEEIERMERPLKNSQVKTDTNFYERFFKFRRDHHLPSHPMVTRNFVKNYKTNYDWWIDTTIENNIIQKNQFGKDIYAIPMFLEVRDPEQWDEESLPNYKKFLKYVAEKDLKTIHNNNLDEFARHFFEQSLTRPEGDYYRVQPYIIDFPYVMNKMPCSIQGGAVFRLGDLAYVPCHRTCYPHFVYGHLIKENDKIVGMEADKATLAIKIKNLNPNRQTLKCADCPIRGFCLKGCLGSQYEHTNELFCAQPNVCDMYYTKYKTINEIAEEYDLYDWVKKSLNFTHQGKEFINYARRTIQSL